PEPGCEGEEVKSSVQLRPSNRPALTAILVIAVYVTTIARGAPPPAAAGDVPALPVIHIDAARDLAPVPRRLFGTGLRPNMQSGEPVRRFLDDTGITLFRYPDALDGGYAWDWAEGGVMTAGGRRLISPL